MASYTAASQLDDAFVVVGAASHTVDDTYGGGGFTDSTGGLQPMALAGGGAWSGPAAGRAAFAGAPAGAVAAGSHDLDATYTGPGYTDQVGGMVPEAAGLSAWDGPTPDRPGYTQPDGMAGVVPAEDHYLEGGANTYIGPGFTESGNGIQPDELAQTGAIIPTAYFRTVNGYVYNEDGDPITNGIYIIALDNFAVAGTVDDTGYYELYLLRQEYENFILVANAPENDAKDEYDYVWYELQGNPDIGVTTTSADLQFDTATPETGRPPGGLNLTGEVNFG